jgi:hypothetical protein
VYDGDVAMGLPELRMSFASADEMAQEYTTNLQHGRAFVLQADAIDVLADCTLVLVDTTSGRELSLAAHAVFVAPGGPPNDVGVELRPFDDTVRDNIRNFIEGKAPPQAEAAPAQGDDASAENAQAQTDETPAAAASQADGDKAPDDETPDDETPDDEAKASDDNADADDNKRPKNRIEMIRKLSQNEQHKMGRSGELSDRVMLERLYGKNVWPDLLANPKLTIPEVARIARKGTVPRPLLEKIIENNRWIHEASVRRALLSNPRIGGEAINKLLRITPKVELKSMSKTTAYPSQVREAARRLFAQMMG